MESQKNTQPKRRQEKREKGMKSDGTYRKQNIKYKWSKYSQLKGRHNHIGFKKSNYTLSTRNLF